MANYTYTVTVASGNLYGGGTGNVYYLDGVRNATGPGTVSWVNGGTLRFDQSEGTNDNHPLVFSTNTSTSGIISSGVTYYLDGASNQANYTNTTTFNAATTRYVEVTPSSETDFYYLCYIHGIGMGGIMDIVQNAWGALGWNQNSWGTIENDISISGLSATSNIGDVIFNFAKGWGGEFWGSTGWGTDIANATSAITGNSLTLAIGSNSVTNEINKGWGAQAWASGSWGNLTDNNGQAVGSQLTSNIGTVTATGVVNIGWGADTWGENLWGELAPAVALPSGVDAVSFTGSVTTTGEVNIGWGRKGWNEGAWGISGTVLVGGQQMSSAIGSVTAEGLIEIGWGRGKWGNRAWGDTFSALLVGQSMTSSVGTVDAGTDFEAAVTGQQLNFDNIGTYSIRIDNDTSIIQSPEHELDISVGTFTVEQTTFEDVTGQQLAMSVGQAVGGIKVPVDVTGQALSTSIGNTVLTGDANVTPATQILASNVGQVDGVSVAEATGSQANISVGQVTNTGTANVSVTGIGLTSGVGTPIIYSWNEIDPNVNNVWTEVDLAA